MSKTIKEQMRVLVKEHERGLLPKDDYRRLRSALLERAVQGKTDAPDEPTHTRPRQVQTPDIPALPPTVTAPRTAHAVPAPTPATAPAPAPTPTPQPAQKTQLPASAKPVRSKLFLLGSVAVGIVALAGAYLFFTNDTAEPVSDTNGAPAVETRETDAIDRLIDEFIQEQDWSPGSIRHFARDWSDLEPEVRGRAKTSSSYREFARELRDRLKLSEQSKTRATTASLRELAESLQLRVDSRFVVADLPEPEAKTPNGNGAKTTPDTYLNNPVAREPEPDAELVTKVIDRSAAKDAKPAINSAIQEKQKAVVDIAKNTASESTVNDVSRTTGTAPAKVVNPRKNEVEPALEGSGGTQSVSAPAAQEQVSRSTENLAADPELVKNTSIATAEAKPVQTKPARVTSSRGSQCTRSVLKTRRKFCRDQLSDGSDGPKLALIRTGKFQMGSTTRDEEQPVHQVAIDKPVAIGVNEVSYAEFMHYCQSTGSVCPDNPWGEKSFPVVNVSWSQARQYTTWLSAQSGATYRLPSEAEWEYAARAGTDTAYPFGEEISYLQAHFSDTKREDRPKPVDGSLVLSNEFGLKHIVGNVSEWVEDTWAANYSRAAANATAFKGSPDERKVIRGGSYHDRATDLRSAARSSLAADDKALYTGFRVAREIH